MYKQGVPLLLLVWMVLVYQSLLLQLRLPFVLTWGVWLVEVLVLVQTIQ